MKFPVRVEAHDVEDAEGVAAAGAGESEREKQSGPREGEGARQAHGHAEKTEHEPPTDGAEGFGEEGGKQSEEEPTGVGRVQYLPEIFPQVGIAENFPEQKRGEENLQNQEGVFAHGTRGNCTIACPRSRHLLCLGMLEATNDLSVECDVVVIGGALSGASTACLLRREDPTLKIVVVEKSETFKRRVGEATVEVSGYFLCRVLGLTKFLTQTQMSKNGLRFWFWNDQCRDLRDCSELGGKYLSTVPSFLIDRAVVDEEVLRRAEAEGVEVWRPATVLDLQLCAGGRQKLRVRTVDGERHLSARWIVDASGIKAMVARSQGWLGPNEKHPTLSAWTRWSGTGDWDEADFLARRGEDQDGLVGIRGTATNHLAGDGWWAWWIALKGGDTSIGVVLDQRKVDWPEEQAPVGEKLKAFLSRHPAAREMMKDAIFIGGDVHFRRNLPYYSTTQAGDGFVLVGDASAFLDPLYSPGMDWISYTSVGAARLVGAWRRGEEIGALIEEHNKSFATSYERMFEALYEGKYDYLGDYDLMRLAFRLDIALYYLFVVRPVFLGGREGLDHPPYAVKEACPIFRLMRGYNRRFGAMARERRRRGAFGRHNAGRRDMFPGFNFRVSQLLQIIGGALVGWLWLEVTEGWRSWGKKSATA